MEWILVKEEKPIAKYNYKILTWNAENIELVNLEYEFYNLPETWEKNGLMGRVTHWMECPKPPSTIK